MSRVEVAVGERTVSLSNLDKVLYPVAGTTKAAVIDYYARIAAVMLPHIMDRGVTLRRFPDGVDGSSFFEKRCANHRPDWVDVALGPGDRGGPIGYCRFTEPASLVWAANMAALEIHAPMARCDDIESPQTLVFDLDPGAPATIVECCRIALALREVLDAVGLQAFPKTSGSKGMQVYVPLNTPHTHDHAGEFALAVGQLLGAPAQLHVDAEPLGQEGGARVGDLLADQDAQVCPGERARRLGCGGRVQLRTPCRSSSSSRAAACRPPRPGARRRAARAR